MSILTRIAGLFNGGTVEKAAAHRRRFDAAAVSRLTAGWMAEQNSIDNELRSDLDRLRARSRDLANNNDYVRKWLQMTSANIVGPNGFLLQVRVEDKPGIQDQFANNAIEAAWAKWGRECDISGRMSFVDLVRAIVKSLARDGEFMLRKVIGRNNAAGYALQLIDIDRLDTGYNVAAAEGRNAVVMGVELDSYSRPVAYHLHSAHPAGAGQRRRERIPAS